MNGGVGNCIASLYHSSFDERERFARWPSDSVQYQQNMMRHILGIAAVGSLLAIAVLLTSLSVVPTWAHEQVKACDVTKDAFCVSPLVVQKLETLDTLQLPKIATPTWLGGQVTAPITREVTYTIATKGNVQADFNEFKIQVNETLNSPLGWSRLGVKFTAVESGGDFHVWLTESSQVPSFSPTGCDAIVSCTVGANVIINETRWVNGSDAWNGAGGSLRDYRSMVVNHETGHWLGHGHEYCSGAGQPAPVMQQQTINMQGCKPNPWPLASEMYAPTLGIRS